MLSFAAAVSAPLRTRSQNALPGTPCVIMATVTRGVSAVPAAIPLPEPRGRPPVLEHDARARTAARTTAALNRHLRLITEQDIYPARPAAQRPSRRVPVIT